MPHSDRLVHMGQQLRRMRRHIRMLEVDLEALEPLRDMLEPQPDMEAIEAKWLRDVGLRLVAYNVGVWRQGIQEPPGDGHDWIDRAIRTVLGSDWGWLAPYVKNGQLAWCGHDQAPSLRAAGLQDTLVRKRIQSCHRLRKAARELGIEVSVPHMQPGDLVLVDSTGDGKPNHITQCWAPDANPDTWPEEYLAAVNRYVAKHGSDTHAYGDYHGDHVYAPHYVSQEGNAKGFGPDGDVYEGHVTRLRPLAHVRLVIRFRREHYEVGA